MNLTLKVWRQQDTKSAGKFVSYQVQGVTPDMSFLEMLDLLNENIQAKGEAPVAFDHDCREGICGMCGFLINGVAHGGHRGTTVCQLSMRFFKDGDSLTLEPWRAKAFPVLRDLAVDRSAFDRIIQAGGFITAPTGVAPDASAILVPKERRGPRHGRGGLHRMRRLRGRVPERGGHAVHRGKDHASQFACRKGSRSATSERRTWSRPCPRKLFGSCTNHGECEAVCPKKIPIEFIGRMNRDLVHATLHRRGE